MQFYIEVSCNFALLAHSITWATLAPARSFFFSDSDNFVVASLICCFAVSCSSISSVIRLQTVSLLIQTIICYLLINSCFLCFSSLNLCLFFSFYCCKMYSACALREEAISSLVIETLYTELSSRTASFNILSAHIVCSPRAKCSFDKSGLFMEKPLSGAAFPWDQHKADLTTTARLVYFFSPITSASCVM